MGALPKRRISTKRRGMRRSQDKLKLKQVKHHSPQTHKLGIVASLKKALGMTA